MRLIIDQLARAIRLSGILSIFFLIITILFVIFFIFAFINSPLSSFSVIIPLVFFAIQYWLFRGYNKACKLVLDTQSSGDLELACRKQALIIKFYGVISFIFLLFMIFSVIMAVLGGAEYVNYINALQQR